MKTIAAKVRIRRGTETEWNIRNPILDEGEAGIVTGTGSNAGKMKVGDGISPWQSLPFVTGVKGDPGVSPVISVAKDTPSEYVLKITNIDGVFETPNLIGKPGNPGVSPVISVAKDTPSEYVLKITNTDEAFETPNLIGYYEICGGRADTHYTGMLHLHGGNAQSA